MLRTGQSLLVALGRVGGEWFFLFFVRLLFFLRGVRRRVFAVPGCGRAGGGGGELDVVEADVVPPRVRLRSLEVSPSSSFAPYLRRRRRIFFPEKEGRRLLLFFSLRLCGLCAGASCSFVRVCVAPSVGVLQSYLFLFYFLSFIFLDIPRPPARRPLGTNPLRGLVGCTKEVVRMLRLR
ncbi:hypothetical protein C8F04DRAFT_46262 [Mycena alexandri]|uniref:Uncharacterized protein n=1 Tax=Mycena alexandri TaxID=1745969 RepID=A0AAD6X1Q9_9AGAR|nr:hypothetical protein C8F04DRAFT_46262 [Mycena alexandri]